MPTPARRKGAPRKATKVENTSSPPRRTSGFTEKKGSNAGLFIGAVVALCMIAAIYSQGGPATSTRATHAARGGGGQRVGNKKRADTFTGTRMTGGEVDILRQSERASSTTIPATRNGDGQRVGQRQHLDASSTRNPPQTTRLEIFHSSIECLDGSNSTIYEASIDKKVSVSIPRADKSGKSMRVRGPGELRLYNGQGKYVATVVELEGCSPVFPFPPIVRGSLVHPDPDAPPKCLLERGLQEKFATASDISEPHTRIVFSAESSDYFGYQTFTNAFAFLNSSQTDASWLRLLTCETPDDLSGSFPTFSAPRSPYSKRYGPINKPDIIEKWYDSGCDAPHPEDIIVVVDPDNFLLKDVHKWTLDVSRKKAVGQAAYYIGMKLVDELWKEVCEEGCDNRVDSVGVPYIVKSEDLKEIAPLWRKYSMIIKEKVETDDAFKTKYHQLNIEWAAEMFGYNFANAHLSIKTRIVRDLQARDVDPPIPLNKQGHPAMIHMGRAWFPHKHARIAEKWRHTEGESFKSRGVQVWCKCNNTASTIIPWPVPDGLDLQSYHTLRLMHSALEHFGPVPENEEYRHKPPGGYYWTKN